MTISKRIPFVPWIPIPAATIHEFSEVDSKILRDLHRGMEVDEEFMSKSCIIRVKPKGHFVTYGVGVSLLAMCNPEEARGRVAV